MMGCTFGTSSTSSDANDEGSPDFRAPERTELNSLDPVVRVPGEYPMAGRASARTPIRTEWFFLTHLQITDVHYETTKVIV